MKRYGFQDLDGQTDTKIVPKTCEVNEKISKRWTNRHTHTHHVVIIIFYYWFFELYFLMIIEACNMILIT